MTTCTTEESFTRCLSWSHIKSIKEIHAVLLKQNDEQSRYKGMLENGCINLSWFTKNGFIELKIRCCHAPFPPVRCRRQRVVHRAMRSWLLWWRTVNRLCLCPHWPSTSNQHHSASAWNFHPQTSPRRCYDLNQWISESVNQSINHSMLYLSETSGK